MARSRVRAEQIGWYPPGHGKDEDSPAYEFLSEHLDASDPAHPHIFRALWQLARLEFPYDVETLNRAIRIGRREHENELAWRARRAALSGRTIEADADSLVYYMRIGNRVKIGFTTVLASRLAAINPEELMAIEPGGYDLEQQRHSEFRHLRTHGEWFALAQPLIGHIVRLQGEAA